MHCRLLHLLYLFFLGFEGEHVQKPTMDCHNFRITHKTFSFYAYISSSIVLQVRSCTKNICHGSRVLQRR